MLLGFCILYIFVISQNSFGERYQHPTIQLGLSLLVYIWFIGIMRAPLEITIVSLSTSLLFILFMYINYTIILKKNYNQTQIVSRLPI